MISINKVLDLTNTEGLREAQRQGLPLVVAYGMGVDSTAMLIGLKQRGIRPDMILFADTGCEKPETYEYIDFIQNWLKENDFPAMRIVTRNDLPGKTVPDRTMLDEFMRLGTLPAPAFGKHTCTAKWKIDPQQYAIQQEYGNGSEVVNLIGLDNSTADCNRTHRTTKYDGGIMRGVKYHFATPLQMWEWDRVKCKEVIKAEGLPEPVKSACYFCPYMKAHEIEDLRDNHFDLFEIALKMEANGLNSGKIKNSKGLGRKFAWTKFLTDKEIDEGIDMTDQKFMDKFMTSKLVMETLGFKSRTSIEQQIKKGLLEFVILNKGTSSEVRMFYKAQVKALKKTLTKK